MAQIKLRKKGEEPPQDGRIRLKKRETSPVMGGSSARSEGAASFGAGQANERLVQRGASAPSGSAATSPLLAPVVDKVKTTVGGTAKAAGKVMETGAGAVHALAGHGAQKSGGGSAATSPSPAPSDGIFNLFDPTGPSRQPDLSTVSGAGKSGAGKPRDDDAIRRAFAAKHPEMTGGEVGAANRELSTQRVYLADAEKKLEQAKEERDAAKEAVRQVMGVGSATATTPDYLKLGQLQRVAMEADGRYEDARRQKRAAEKAYSAAASQKALAELPSDPDELQALIDAKREEIAQAEAQEARAIKEAQAAKTRQDKAIRPDTEVYTIGGEVVEKQPSIDQLKSELNMLSRKQYEARNLAAIERMGQDPQAAVGYARAVEVKRDEEKLKGVLLWLLNPTSASAEEVQGFLEDREMLKEKYGLTEEDFTAYANGDPTSIQTVYDKMESQISQSAQSMGEGYDFEDIYGFTQRLQRQQERREKDRKTAQFAKDHPIIASVASVLASPFQAFDILNMDWGKGEPGDPDYIPPDASGMDVSSLVNTIRGMVSEEIEIITDWELFGQNVGSFLYQTGMSMGDSALLVSTLGPGSVYLMGTNAAVNGAKDIVERGGTADQAMWGGLAAGMAEVAFEKVSVDNLLTPKTGSGWRYFLKETLKQGGIEASEETLTEIANILSDAAVMAADSNWDRAVAAYEADGLSREEAKRKAFLDCVAQVTWAGAGGFVSGVGMGGGKLGLDHVGQRVSQTPAGTQETVSEGETVSGTGLVPISDAERQHLSTGKRNVVADTVKDIISFAKNALSKKGGQERLYMGVIPDNVAAMVQELTRVDIKGYKAILTGDAVQHTWNHHGDPMKEQARGQRAVTAEDYGMLTTVLAAPDSVRLMEGRDSAGRALLRFSKMVGDTDVYVTAQAVTDSRHVLTMDTMWVQKKKGRQDTTHNADVAADPVDNARSVPPQGPSIDSIPQTRADVNLTQKAEAGGGVGSDQAVVTQYAREATDLGRRGREVLAASYLEGQGAEGYVLGMREFYRAGREGRGMEEVQSPEAGTLSEEQRKAAWLAGQLDAGEEASASSPAVGNPADQQTKETPGPRVDENPGLDTEARAWFERHMGPKVAKAVDETARMLGTRVVMVEPDSLKVGDATANAQINGPVILMEKGDPNAGLKVLGHEFTHRLQDLDRDAYLAFRAFVEQHYEGTDVVQWKQALYERATGQAYTHEMALDEVAADYAGELLADGKLLEQFIQAHSGQNRTVLQRFLDWVRSIMDKLTGRERTQAEIAEQKLMAALEAGAQRAAELTEAKNAQATAQAQDAADQEASGGVKHSLKDDRKYDPETASVKEQITNSQETLAGMSAVVTVRVPEHFTKKSDAVKWATELLAKTGYAVERQGYGKITFSPKDINHAMNYADTDAEMAAIAALPNVLKRGIEIGRHNDHKGRKKSTVTFAAPVVLNGTRGNMAVVINQNGDHYYAHRIVMPDGSAFVFATEKSDVAQEPSRGVAVSSSLADTTSATSMDSISRDGGDVNMKILDPTQSLQFKRWFGDWQNDPEKASKVVDAEGKPLVVYHGTAAEFNTFQSEDGAFWFSAEADYAEEMAHERGGERVVQAYLDMKNPYYATLEPGKFTDPAFEGPIIQAARDGGHDGVILRADTENELLADTFYIVFEPTQIKSATDNIGTFDKTNPDIRYSIKEAMVDLQGEIDRVIQEGEARGDNPETIQAAVQEMVAEAYQAMGEKYGTIKPGENPAREVAVPRRTAKDKKVSQTVRTILEAEATPEVAIPSLEELTARGEFSYEVYTDKAAMKDAESKLRRKGWDNTLEEWKAEVKKGAVSKENTTMGWLLYNNAVNDGNVQTALDILNLMVKHQRNAAQAVQATRILKKMSPEAQLYNVQRSVWDLQEELNKRYGDKKSPKLEIPEELAEELLEATSQEERERTLHEIGRSIGRQLPSTFGDKWNAWRYLAMLGNPRTHIRNIAGNAGFMPVVAVKDMTATAIEAIVGRVSGGRLERTKGAVGIGKGDRALLKAAWGDYASVRAQALGEGKYSDRAMMDKSIEEGRRIFKSRVLEGARRGNGAMLDLEDAWFSQPHYAYALAQFCKANGITAEELAAAMGLRGTTETGTIGKDADHSREDAEYGGAVEEEYRQSRDTFRRESTGCGLSVVEGEDGRIYAFRCVERRGRVGVQGWTLSEGSRAGGQGHTKNTQKTVSDRFRAWGISADVIDGYLYVHKNGVTTKQRIKEAVTLKGGHVVIPQDSKVPLEDTLGHEAFHVWKRSWARDRFVAAIRDNLNYSSEAFLAYQQKIADAYFGGEVDLADAEQLQRFEEELFAYIAGQLNEGGYEDTLRPILRDYEAARTAWDALVQENTRGEARREVEHRQGGQKVKVEDGLLAKARAYAVLEAQKATYRDTNALSQWVSSLGRPGKDANMVKRAIGVAMEGVLPFRKTPANILMRGVEYSPIGLVKSLSWDMAQVARGKMTGAEAIDHISAGLTGTGLMLLGVFLAAQGLVRGGGDDEKKKEFEELQGHQDYALEVGGSSVTLDWLAPEALPFFIGVNLYEQTRGNWEETKMEDVLAAVGSVTEPLLEMSCLQSLNDLLETVQYGDNHGIISIAASTATSYLTQALPTLLGQAERSGEGERMTTYTDRNKFLTTDMQYTIGRASARVPGLDYAQIPYIDAWGRAEDTGSLPERIVKNFLNPSYTDRIDSSAMEDELMRLYEATGDDGVFPSRMTKYFNVDGQRKDLTAEEYVTYATVAGQEARRLAVELTASREYEELDDAERALAIRFAYQKAKKTGQGAVAEVDEESWMTKAREAKKRYNIDEGTYISLKVTTSGIESLKDKNGETIANSKGLQIMEAVYAMPGLNDRQRQAMFEYLGVGKTVRHYNKVKVAEDLRKMRRGK